MIICCVHHPGFWYLKLLVPLKALLISCVLDEVSYNQSCGQALVLSTALLVCYREMTNLPCCESSNAEVGGLLILLRASRLSSMEAKIVSF